MPCWADHVLDINLFSFLCLDVQPVQLYIASWWMNPWKCCQQWPEIVGHNIETPNRKVNVLDCLNGHMTLIFSPFSVCCTGKYSSGERDCLKGSPCHNILALDSKRLGSQYLWTKLEDEKKTDKMTMESAWEVERKGRLRKSISALSYAYILYFLFDSFQ